MAREGRSKRILIIDNDEAVLDVLSEILTYEGYQVTGLLETPDILKEINQHEPDILIIDYILDGINGGEMCHQVKFNEATCKLPVVLMSAHSRVIRSLGDYHCDVFISKPFDLKEMTDSISSLTRSDTFLERT
ncbi:response regulator [Mucilaginibacter daejeonensis]|uniref:response regulator n=1 Tax=Mucilaginibacter daejeonensis TaxID=398049 RepID=UPI001D1798B0|nr:response regulator [Mucilaginibacter daejeonensis]UEG52442.1 response regulator [Mucilaginibacter daejeonensis]